MVNRAAVFKARVAFFWRRPRTVPANVNWLASVLQVVRSVLLAGRVRQARFRSILVNFNRISAVARATFVTVDNDLSIKTDWRRTCVPIQDVESVSDGGGGSLGPARATIARNVLVLVPRHVVHTVHISPVPSWWQILTVKFFESACS